MTQPMVRLLAMILLSLVTSTGAGITRTGLVVVREEAGDRVKRAVGPVGVDINSDINNDIGGQQQRKYRRLEHSIMVQADIRSRSEGDIVRKWSLLKWHSLMEVLEVEVLVDH